MNQVRSQTVDNSGLCTYVYSMCTLYVHIKEEICGKKLPFFFFKYFFCEFYSVKLLQLSYKVLANEFVEYKTDHDLSDSTIHTYLEWQFNVIIHRNFVTYHLKILVLQLVLVDDQLYTISCD